MLEVLLTIFIVTVGLLGLVGLQVIAQEQEFESYQRAQALVLMNDVVDRINTNRKAAACYAITTDASGGFPYLGTTGGSKYDLSGYACPSLATNPAAVTRAGLDLQFIDDLLLGATEKISAGNVGAMVGARACIGYDAGSQTYAVAVAWQGLSATFSPATWDAAKTPAYARNCALNLYGSGTSDAQRRVVWTTMLIANLGL